MFKQIFHYFSFIVHYFPTFYRTWMGFTMAPGHPNLLASIGSGKVTSSGVSLNSGLSTLWPGGSTSVANSQASPSICGASWSHLRLNMFVGLVMDIKAMVPGNDSTWSVIMSYFMWWNPLIAAITCILQITDMYYTHHLMNLMMSAKTPPATQACSLGLPSPATRPSGQTRQTSTVTSEGWCHSAGSPHFAPATTPLAVQKCRHQTRCSPLHFAYVPVALRCF